MSAEHGPQPIEQSSENQELQDLAAERLLDLTDTSAKNPEASGEKRAEAARELLKKHEVQPEPVSNAGEKASQASFIKRMSHGLNYSDTLSSLQRRLSPRSRAFSKVIHAPVVEKTSAVLEKTIMRPSVTLGATWTALIVGTIFYVAAKYYGFPLSGSEMILALIVGGILGAGIEWSMHLVRHRAK